MRKLIAVLIPLVVGRMLLLPVDALERDAEVKAAYIEYRYCVRIDIFCAPSYTCPYPNCMGDFLRRSENINRKHSLLFVLKPRHLLSGWQPIP